LKSANGAVHLNLVNDGKAYPMHGKRMHLPQSLQERVEQAGGSIDLSRGMGVTKLSILLPAEGRGA
jgi:signal transduction histidine kinase